jgi:hypothetical protein
MLREVTLPLLMCNHLEKKKDCSSSVYSDTGRAVNKISPALLRKLDFNFHVSVPSTVELDPNTAPRRILQPQNQNRPAMSSAVACKVKEKAKKPAKGVALSKLILVKKSKTGKRSYKFGDLYSVYPALSGGFRR